MCQHRKSDDDPVAPFPFAQHDFRIIEDELCQRPFGVQVDLQGHLRFGRFCDKRIHRTSQGAIDHMIFHGHPLNVTTRNISRPFVGIAGEIRELAIASLQVRRSHSGQRGGFAFGRRKIDRHPENRAGNTMVFKMVPERLTAAAIDNLPRRKRDLPGPKRDQSGGRDSLCDRMVRNHRFGIAGDEIENPVSTGIGSRNEIRPRHRTLRRIARPQWVKGTLLHETGAMRHPPFCDELLKQRRIHTVDAQDNHSFEGFT